VLSYIPNPVSKVKIKGVVVLFIGFFGSRFALWLDIEGLILGANDSLEPRLINHTNILL
jgi:hypothetical protein